MNTMRIRAEGPDVQIIKDGKLVAQVPWDAALEVARTITQMARRSESFAKREGILTDGRMLLVSNHKEPNPAKRALARILLGPIAHVARHEPEIGRLVSAEEFGMPRVVAAKQEVSHG